MLEMVGGGEESQYGVCKCVFVDRVSILSVYMVHYSLGGHYIVGKVDLPHHIQCVHCEHEDTGVPLVEWVQHRLQHLVLG